MTRSGHELPSTIIEACRKCPSGDRRGIVAFCCYMAFADRAIRWMEVAAVRAVAAEMQIAPADVARMARQVRRRTLTIARPRSQAARRLLFQLAIRLAAADDRVDPRERAALDKLARQLKLADVSVDDELAKVGRGPERDSILRSRRPAVSHPPGLAAGLQSPKGFFARLLDWMTGEA